MGAVVTSRKWAESADCAVVPKVTGREEEEEEKLQEEKVYMMTLKFMHVTHNIHTGCCWFEAC